MTDSHRMQFIGPDGVARSVKIERRDDEWMIIWLQDNKEIGEALSLRHAVQGMCRELVPLMLDSRAVDYIMASNNELLVTMLALASHARAAVELGERPTSPKPN